MVVDRFQRPLSSLRISVTDRCNMRCAYCMPEENYAWLPTSEILSFEEISALVDDFIALGVRKVRLTGGEPLLRRDLPTLVSMLRAKPLDDLALTTNGVALAEHAQALADAGLDRVTVSLDTLNRERFVALTRRDNLEKVLAGIEAARRVRFRKQLKLDAVMLNGINDDELLDLLNFGTTVGAEVRFIEYMDVGGATQWNPRLVLSRAEIMARLKADPLDEARSAPAERFRLPDGRIFGIIGSTTAPFCGTCDRVRLTADGHLFTCLYGRHGTDLKTVLRSKGDIRSLISTVWSQRLDRSAEERLRLSSRRAPSVSARELQQNPRLEMHTRGG